MKLREIYETAVRMGIEADPRGKAGVDEFLARTKKRYDALPDHLKDLADAEGAHQPLQRHAHLRRRPRPRGQDPARRHRHEHRRGAARRPPAREGHGHRRHLHASPRGLGPHRARQR